MKKKVFRLTCVLIACFMYLSNINAADKITLYLFRGDGCPHCEAALEYISSIQKDHPTMEVVTYEVFNHQENVALWNTVKETLGSDSKGVPFIVIGERYLTGFAEYRKADIEAALKYYEKHPNEYKDVVLMVRSGSKKENQVQTKDVVEDIKPVEMHEEKNRLYRNLFITTGLLVICGGVYYWLSRKEKRA